MLKAKRDPAPAGSWEPRHPHPLPCHAMAGRGRQIEYYLQLACRPLSLRLTMQTWTMAIDTSVDKSSAPPAMTRTYAGVSVPTRATGAFGPVGVRNAIPRS